jgi:hypothetical protein
MGNSTSQAQRQQFLDLWNTITTPAGTGVGPNTVLEPIFKAFGLDNVFVYEQCTQTKETILWFAGDSYKLLGYHIVLAATQDKQGTINAKQVITVSFCKDTVTKHGIQTVCCVSRNRCTTLSACTRAIKGIITRNKAALEDAAASVQAEAQARLAQADLLIQTIQKL